MKRKNRRDEEGGWGVGGGERTMMLVLSPQAKGFLMTFGFLVFDFQKDGEREKNNKNTSGRNFISFT